MKSIASGEHILVTGFSGSIGGALIPALLDAGAVVRGFSRDEKKQLDLRRQYPEIECRLGDVRDAAAVREAMRGIETVIHAASLKFLDVSERQPSEYAKTNVFGAINILEAARESATVRKCVGVSTDKVPNAKNTYGLTKALLEKLFMESHAMTNGISRLSGMITSDLPLSESAITEAAERWRAAFAQPLSSGQILVLPSGFLHTRMIGKSFTVARYGNVAGSRGSVIPFWAEKRRKNEPLPVTDPTMTRFLFTLDEAVTLLDYALSAESGSIVSLPMSACSLGQLAEIMKPAAGVQIVGRRPGEKTHEELLTDDEMARTRVQDGYFIYDPRAEPNHAGREGYTSDRAPQLTDDELRELVKGWL